MNKLKISKKNQRLNREIDNRYYFNKLKCIVKPH